jgi:hypothetical protein
MRVEETGLLGEAIREEHIVLSHHFEEWTSRESHAGIPVFDHTQAPGIFAKNPLHVWVCRSGAPRDFKGAICGAVIANNDL